MELEEYQESTMGRLLQATYGLWNALLTVNGIMLTVFSALYAISPRGAVWSVRVLIFCCVASVCLLVLNHVAMKRIYFRMGEVITGIATELTEKRKEQDLKTADRWHKVQKFGEGASLFLLVVEVMLVLLFTFSLSNG